MERDFFLGVGAKTRSLEWIREDDGLVKCSVDLLLLLGLNQNLRF